MPDNHIMKTLDEMPFGSLGDAEIARVESHIATCEQCKSAYDAAKAAAFLIQARASETVEPGPFFKTRVMAAIRERQLAPEEPALVRMWRAAGALISTMALLLVILTVVTVFSRSQTTAAADSQNLYSPEYVVLQQGDTDADELVNDQVLGTVYDLEDDDGQ